MVVFAHVCLINPLHVFFYGFHMPLFFFLSGYLYRSCSLSELIEKRFRGIYLPFAFFYLLTLIYFWAVERHFVTQPLDYPEAARLFPLIWGSNAAGIMRHNIVLWFLPALMTTEILWCVIEHKIKSVIGQLAASLGLFLIGLALVRLRLGWLPGGLNMALFVVIFFNVGNLFAHYRLIVLSKIQTLALGASLLFLYGATMASDYFTGYDLALHVIDIFFIPLALCGLLGVVFLSMLLPCMGWLMHVGRSSSTLVIMALHGPIYRILLWLTANDAWGRNTVSYPLLITALAIAACLPLAYLYNRHVQPRFNQVSLLALFQKLSPNRA